MSTGIKPDQARLSRTGACALDSRQVADRTAIRARRSALEQGMLERRLTDRFGTPFVFFFDLSILLERPAAAKGRCAAVHDEVLRAQALHLAKHAVTLHSGFAIDDIYAHPLLRPTDVLSGHRMRAFIAAPIRGAARELTGVACAADLVTRRWSGPDLTAMQRIVAQFEALRLSQS